MNGITAKAIVAMGLAALGSTAGACVCPMEKPLTLEARVDAADRVLLIRVTAAHLEDRSPRGEMPLPAEGALFLEPYALGQARYEYRVIEAMKGGTLPTPEIASYNGTDCAHSLRPGDFVLVLAPLRQRQLDSSQCTLDRLIVLGPHLGSARPMLDGVREYLRTRAKIHPCDNEPLPPDALREQCRQRRRDAGAEENRRRERMRGGV